MSNVLGDNKQQQVLALARLGWSLQRIEQATTVRREKASAYLKAVGIPGASAAADQVRAPTVVHEVTIQQLQRWLDGASISPNEAVRKAKLKSILE